MPYEVPEHPEVAHALLTGYPHPVRSVRCTDCDQEFSGGEAMYISDGEPVCPDCARERILEAYDTADLAFAFGIPHTTAGEYLDRLEGSV